MLTGINVTNPFGMAQLMQWDDFGVTDGSYYLLRADITNTTWFMGMCNIWLEGDNAKNRDGRMGISISPEYWNKGYGTEVLKFVVDYSFRWLALHRVSLRVFESNKGTIRL